MANRRVLVTGAAGYVASQMLDTFRDRYDLVLLDRQAEDREGMSVPGVLPVDLTDRDRKGYADHFDGVDAVVHLAYTRRRVDPLDNFFEESKNVDMAYNMLRCAYDAGVRRFVFASSNHAADWYEHRLIHARMLDMLDPYAVPLSDNFYGWAKATVEHMGFLFACGAFGRKMGMVNVRIGGPRELDARRAGGDADGFNRGLDTAAAAFKRDLGVYVSPRDLTQLFVKAIEVDDIDDEHGVPWHVVYGISDNTRAFWPLANARRVLGYAPQDDSEVRYADDIRGFLAGEGATGDPGRVG